MIIDLFLYFLIVKIIKMIHVSAIQFMSQLCNVDKSWHMIIDLFLYFLIVKMFC